MTIRQFVPVAVLVVGGLTYGATQVGVPAPPITVISAFAAILLTLQLENRKLADLLGELVRAFKDQHHA